MRRVRIQLLLVTTIASFAVVGASARPAHSLAAPTSLTGTLHAEGLQRLARLQWRAYRAKAGAAMIRVSLAYADADGIAARWSAYFDSLVHGSELPLLDAYIAPLAEVQEICGGGDVLGCYGDDHLVIPDQAPGRVAATSIAAHEYGHHVANNRLNPPWRAIDWGTKRWATAMHVCERVTVGTAFPGAEDADYPLNPGEALAESYRVLNETAVGLPPTWPIVDPSFLPDAAALEALRQDIVDPWAAPRVTTRRVAFSGVARTWTMRVATPLDGDLRVDVPSAADLTLRSVDGRQILATGSWSGSGRKSATYRVCGARSLQVRLRRSGAAARFTLRMTIP